MEKKYRLKKAAGILMCTVVLVSGALYSVNATDRMTSVEKDKKDLNCQIEKFEEMMTVGTGELTAVSVSKDVTSENEAEADASEEKTYFDKQGNIYEISEDGRIGMFMVAEYDSEAEDMISIQEAQSIAAGCLNIISPNGKYQIVNVDMCEDLGYYRIEYCYYMGEYETTDRMYFEIAADGTVIGYNAAGTGNFDGLSMDLRDRSDLEKEAVLQLQNEYIDYSDFTVENVVIAIENDAPCYKIESCCTDRNTGEQKTVSTTIY